MKRIGLVFMIVLAIGFLQSCKNKDPSIVKVFVKGSSYYEPAGEGVKVILIGDVDSNPATLSWVDTVTTNSSGVAEFNLKEHFEQGVSTYGKKYEVAYFDIIAKTPDKETSGRVRSRVHTTAVETVYLQ